MLLSGLSFAQENVESSPCQIDTIKPAFKQYVQTATQEQVVNIQEGLLARGYGPIEADGVLGQDTRRELQRFCLAQEQGSLNTSGDIATALVDLLQQTPPEANVVPVEAPAPEPAQTETPIEVDSTQSEAPEPSVDIQVAKPEAPVPQSNNATSQPEATLLANYRWGPAEEEEGEPAPESASLPEQESGISEAVTEALTEIEGVSFPNAFTFTQAIGNLFSNSEEDYTADIPLVLAQSQIVPGPQTLPLEVTASDCGCSLEFSSLVYGFYPYWLADGEQQAIDFSLFDRIAFYALALNEKGGMDKLLQWSDESDVAKFIHTAHKHRVAVDVTIQATAWQEWDELAVQRAVSATEEAVIRRFNDASEGMLSKLNILGGRDAEAQVDGVTLMFNGYSDSQDKRVNIINYVTQLSEQLAKQERAYQVNILLNVNVNDLEQQTGFKDLDSILLGEQAPVTNLFVFLQQPTSNAKKALRRVIEDEFRGGQRREMLRKIVPIISPHGHENEPRGAYSQFIDDLIYLQDNFAGTALWPLPLANDEGMETIRENIIDLYVAKDEGKIVTQLLDEHLPGLCEFACPNRWGFRLTFNVLAAVLVIYGVAAIWFYQLRTYARQQVVYFSGYGVVTVLVLLTSLVCDPYWRERADLVIGGILLLFVAGIVLRLVSRSMRPPLP